MNQQDKQHNSHDDFFQKAKIPYSRSKEDVWANMMQQLDAPENEEKTRTLKPVMWAIAASIILLLSIGGFMRFYTKSYHAPAGQHLAMTLPDGSDVTLNANTQLQYHPYWWQFSRKLKLSGEAFFQVTPGNKFSVTSKQGVTSVLGTQFNIYARETRYRVHCLTGKVDVKSKQGDSRVITANQAVSVETDGSLKYQEKIEVEQAIAWRKNEFIFTATPLREVLEEMERQFDIVIEVPASVKGSYTGNFKRGSSPQETLEQICMPFGLQVEKIGTDHFKIIPIQP